MKLFSLLSKHSLIISIVITAVFFFAFYPAKYINIDEHDYLNNAKLLVDGGLKSDCNLKILGQWNAGDYCISKYNIGTSLFLIPAILINDNFAFLTTFLIFIFSIFIFYKLLKKFKINPIFLYFFAFYPSFIYFSRTILSEIYSMTFILLSFYLLIEFLYKNKKLFGIIAGVAMGISVFIRYTNIIPLFVLTLIILLQNINSDRIEGLKKSTLKNIKKFFPVLLGIIPLLIILMIFNQYNYGGILRSGYYYAFEEGVFVFGQVPIIFLKYLVLFCISYPAMLFLSLYNKNKYKLALYSSFLSMLIFYIFIRNLSFEGRLTDIILGTRYALPVIPFIILLYSDSLNRFVDKRMVKYCMIILVTVLIVGVAIVNFTHYRYLENSVFSY